MWWVVIATNKDGEQIVAVITSNDSAGALRKFEENIRVLPLSNTVTVIPVDHYIGELGEDRSEIL